jgi:hypothetical protein
MNKLQMDPAPGDSTVPRLVVRVQRQALPPTPWAWMICEEGQSEPVRCSARLYRSAEDAWTMGRAVLGRLPGSAYRLIPLAREDPGADHGPRSG